MKKRIMVIDEEKDFIEKVFKPKLSVWNVEYDIITNQTFGDILEEYLPDFSKEVINIVERNREGLEAIFLDLGLNKSDESASLGFRLGRNLRDTFVEIPIIALTRFEDIESRGEGYLYDLDRYITKTEFAELSAVEFNGILHQVVKKRERFVEKLPLYYDQLRKSRKEFTTVSAFGRNFSRPAVNFEVDLKDSISIGKTLESVLTETIILFADLCNSTEIKEKQGYFEGLYLTRIHNEIVTDILYQMGGKLVKYIGDCVMARFDYKAAKEIDAASINTAIRINEALERHNKEYRKNAAFRLETKIGISVGQVIDFYGGDPQGLCVDLAARLQSLAKSGQVLVSAKLHSLVNSANIISKYGEATSRKPEEYFRGPHKEKLKGFTDDQEYYEVFWKI